MWFGGIVAAAVVWSFTTFATIDYVKEKHAGVMELLTEIRHDVKELLKQKGD